MSPPSRKKPPRKRNLAVKALRSPLFGRASSQTPMPIGGAGDSPEIQLMKDQTTKSTENRLIIDIT